MCYMEPPSISSSHILRTFPSPSPTLSLASAQVPHTPTWHFLNTPGKRPSMSRQHPGLPHQGSAAGLPCEQSSTSFWHSQPSPLLLAHRSTRNLPQTADVVVIGSGITGASVAHHLLAGNNGSKDSDHGLNVVMLEAREACWGATGRNGGHCQPLLFETPHDPSIGHFELANFHALQKLIVDNDIDCEFVAQPGVRAIYSRHHLKEAEMALDVMKITAPDLHKMMRLITSRKSLARYRIPSAKGALITDTAARMWPYKFVAHILSSLLTATDLEGTFNLQTLTPVTSLSASSDAPGWIVHTPRGTIHTQKVVLATNAYTSHLLPTFADLIVPAAVRCLHSSLCQACEMTTDCKPASASSVMDWTTI